MKVTLDISPEHFAALESALHLIARFGSGQFSWLAHLHNADEKADEFDAACKSVLMPGYMRHASYGIHNPKVPKTSKLCWEMYCTIRHTRGDGGTWRGKPMPCSGEPMPVVTIDNQETHP